MKFAAWSWVVLVYKDLAEDGLRMRDGTSLPLFLKSEIPLSYLLSSQKTQMAIPGQIPLQRRFHLYLVAFRGQPQDLGTNRHVALFFESTDTQSYDHITYHVQNFGLFWEMERRLKYNPSTSTNLVGRVDMDSISIDVDELHRMMDGIEIINDPEEGESSCQIWLEKAMSALCDAGYITTAVYERAIEGMTDIVLEGMQC